jgi:hypothetical protein
MPLDVRSLETWKRTPPKPTPMIRELDGVYNGLVRTLAPDSKIEINFGSTLRAERIALGELIYAVYCLQAIDSIGYLIDALSDDRGDVRAAALFAMKHWTGGSPDRDLKLHQELIKKKQFAESEADRVLQLLHGFSRDLVEDPPTIESLFTLLETTDKIALRELAYFWLVKLEPTGGKDIRFDPGASVANRDQAIKRWRMIWNKKMTEKKK